jgi:hypothetical protein
MFMDAAFGAVRTAIGFLEIKLSAHHADFCTNSNLTAEQEVNYLCQQCEASLQFLQSLCQQKMFRERLLRNKVFQLEPLSSFFFFFSLLLQCVWSRFKC